MSEKIKCRWWASEGLSRVVWGTACGSLDEPGITIEYDRHPDDVGYKYCPYCGNKIEIQNDE